MEEQDEFGKIMERLKRIRPRPNMEKLNEANRGMGSVLRYLADESCPVSPGQIAEALGVSTARAAVLIRKLVSSGMITRTQDPEDARRIQIALTERGIAFNRARERDFEEMIHAVVDEIGADEMNAYLDSAEKIFAAVGKYMKAYTLPPIDEGAEE